MVQNNKRKSVAKIISAAEELFACSGYHGASIREIAQKAGVNLAAINYHFRDKQSLFCEVISHHVRPLNQARLKELSDAAERAGQAPIPLALIIDIFARPVFELCGNPENVPSTVAQLLGRCIVEPLPFIDALLAVELHPTTARFARAIRRHVSTLTPEEFMWRLNFVVGAMHHTLATTHRLKELTRGLCQNNDSTGALRHFIPFAVATLTAPTTALRREPQ